MYTMNMTAQQEKYFMEAQTELSQRFFSAVGSYLSKNADLILSGLAAMNGSMYVPAGRR